MSVSKSICTYIRTLLSLFKMFYGKKSTIKRKHVPYAYNEFRLIFFEKTVTFF